MYLCLFFVTFSAFSACFPFFVICSIGKIYIVFLVTFLCIPF